MGTSSNIDLEATTHFTPPYSDIQHIVVSFMPTGKE